jgi:GNAT superfamily N-acetyltransferase
LTAGSDGARDEVLRLQSFLRTSAARGRMVLKVGPFDLFLDDRDASPFSNYAIPRAGAQPEAGAVGDLRATFQEHERRPRLEWIAETAPDVAAVLGAAGMQEELRAPLMACSPPDLVDAPAGPGTTIAPVGDDDLRTCFDLQRRAFGDPPLADDDEPRDPRRHGGGAVLVRVGGVPASAATWTPVIDGVSEIVGVATEEAYRGQGLAGLVTAAATSRAFEAGAALAVLSPGGDEAQRVYARAGFRPAATMLHWSDPA